MQYLVKLKYVVGNSSKNSRKYCEFCIARVRYVLSSKGLISRDRFDYNVG